MSNFTCDRLNCNLAWPKLSSWSLAMRDVGQLSLLHVKFGGWSFNLAQLTFMKLYLHVKKQIILLFCSRLNVPTQLLMDSYTHQLLHLTQAWTWRQLEAWQNDIMAVNSWFGVHCHFLYNSSFLTYVAFYPASRGFFLARLSACMKLFLSLYFA